MFNLILTARTSGLARFEIDNLEIVPLESDRKYRGLVFLTKNKVMIRSNSL